MGVLIAVVDKKGNDATKTVVEMLEASKLKKAAMLGIGSSNTIRIKRTIEELQDQVLGSPILIGSGFAKILEADKPQPMRVEDAAFVFEGRIYNTSNLAFDTRVFAKDIRDGREGRIGSIIEEQEGDFVFAIAESNMLIVGRDVMGTRPLYYGENDHLEAVASERKALWKVGIDARSFPPGYLAMVTASGFRFKTVRTLPLSQQRQSTLSIATEKLGALLRESITKRVSGLKQVAVAFSGGLDSSVVALLAKRSKSDVHLVHASLANRPETEHAVEAASELDLPIHLRLFEEKDVEEALRRVLWLIEEADPLKVSIGIPVYWMAQEVAKMKIKVILTGQGADELFGGYKRYADIYQQEGTARAQEAVLEDIAGMHQDNFERDFKICVSQGVELRLPFATYGIVELAASLPMKLKIHRKSGSRKIVLRSLAKDLGLPDFIAERQKKAIQYATGVAGILRKLAQKRRLSLKEYIQREFQTIFKREVL